jgi:hypothetical protein
VKVSCASVYHITLIDVIQKEQKLKISLPTVSFLDFFKKNNQNTKKNLSGSGSFPPKQAKRWTGQTASSTRPPPMGTNTGVV